MSMWLKQSTASQEILIGPFLDDTDGKTAETGLTIANTDIKLWKEGTTTEANKNSGGATHIAAGRYYAVLDATDTDTLGKLEVNIHVSGALPVRREFMVLPANIYDSLVSSSDYLQVDAAEMSGAAVTTVNSEIDTALTDIHLDHLFATDYDPASKPGTATALLNELVENDGGVSRFTANALEQAPGGSGGNPQLLQSTTIATLASQTSFTLTAGSADDVAYENALAIVTDQSTSTQKCVGFIESYTGSTKTVTLKADPGVFTMAVGDTIDIVVGINQAFPNNFQDLQVSIGTGQVTVGTNQDKTGYEIAGTSTRLDDLNDPTAAAIADAVWDEATSGHTTAGTFGEQCKTDIDAILADTNELQTDWVNGGRLDTIIDSILTDTGTTLETHLTDIKGGTFSGATDSLEAIRDRGDAAWTTGAGGNPPQLLQSTTIATLASQTSFTLTAGSSDDDAYNGAVIVITDQSTSTQKAVGTISDYTGSTKTVTLSADPAIFTMAVGDSVSIIAALGSASSAPTAAAIRAEIDSNSTQLAAIVADTNELQTDWTNGGRLDLIIDAILTDTNEVQTDLADGGRIDLLIDGIKAVTDVIPDSGSMTSIATAAALTTVDTVVDGIKAKTDSLTFTDAGKVDATLQAAADIKAAVANKVADHTLRRSLASALSSSDGDTKGFRSLAGSVAKHVNKVALSGSTLTVYETDDSTSLGTQTATTSSSASPITTLDTD